MVGLYQEARLGDEVNPTGPGEAEVVEGSDETETDAIETAASDDAIGFEELVGAARPALVRAAHSVTGRHEDAEDAVQSSL